MTSCGMRCGTRYRSARAFVKASAAMTVARTGQNSAALLLRIFLTLLAVEAVARVRERVQPLEGDVVAARVTLPERLGRAVQAAQRLVDVPEEPPFLARHEERL